MLQHFMVTILYVPFVNSSGGGTSKSFLQQMKHEAPTVPTRPRTDMIQKKCTKLTTKIILGSKTEWKGNAPEEFFL